MSYTILAALTHANGDRFERRQWSTHECIVKTHQAGTPCETEGGGYPVVNVGAAAHVDRCWRKLVKENQVSERFMSVRTLHARVQSERPASRTVVK